MKKAIHTDRAPAAIGPYSQAVRAGGFLFTSGQIPVDPAAGDIPAGIKAQAQQSLDNIAAILAQAGLDRSAVVKTTVFLKDMNDFAARRKLTGEFPDGKVDMKKLSDEYDELEQEHNTTYGEFKTVRDDLHRLWKVKSCVDTAARFNERTEEQKLQNRPQTRQKKEELSR